MAQSALASDWILLMDEEHSQVVFPPKIMETVIVIELTVPPDKNLANTYAKEKCNYQDLVAECENRKWTVYYFPVEVGSSWIYYTS